jgi:uncharacterized protein DUF4401/predicted membrane protein DUF2157
MINDRQVQIETEQLLALRKNPHISKKTLERAYELAFPVPTGKEWQSYLNGLFYTLGGALLIWGLLFFVDYHWSDLSYWQRCAVFGLSTTLCAMAAYIKGRASTAGKVALSCASLLLGGFLIVVSQVHTTGEWHVILTLWAALILPWCIVAEFAPLWLFATGLFNVTLYVVCRELFEPWFFSHYYFHLCVLALNLLLLINWEFGFWQGRTWMGRRWFPPLLTLMAIIPATWSLGHMLVEWSHGINQFFPLAPAMAVVWSGLLYYYSKVRRDISVLSLTLGSCVFLGTCILWRLVLHSREPGVLLLLAIGVVAQISIALGLLRRMAPALPADPKAPSRETPDVKIWLGQLATEGFLHSTQLEDIELAMKEQNEGSLPWLVRAMTATGAFVASLFLLLYLLVEGVVTEHNGVLFGLAMCAFASFTASVSRSEFIAQACLSVSFCGQLAAWLAFALTHDRIETALFMAGLELALVASYPSVFGKFLSVNLSGLFVAYWLTLSAPTIAIDLLVILVACLVVFLWVYQHQILAGPYARAHAPVAMGSVTLLFMLLLSTIVPIGTLPPIGVTGALGLTALAVLAARGLGAPNRVSIQLAIAGLLACTAPGVMAAVLVLLLGFYRRSQTMRGLAITFLLAFGSAYYYHLDLSLLQKSLVLIVSGAAFLYMAKSVEQSRE